jgi:hypothetical protein
MKKFIFLSASIVALSMFIPVDAVACGCVSMGTTLEQDVKGNLKRVKAVFTGEVIEITPNPKNYGFITKLKVEESWKDFSPEEIIIIQDGSSCEYHFTTGKKYLVFAYEWENKLTTDVCIGNRELEKASEELKILGKGKEPPTNNLQETSQPPVNSAYQNQKFNVGQLPIADYNGVLPTNLHERKIREKRNKLRNIKLGAETGVFDAKRFMITEQRDSSYGGFPTHASPEPAIPAATSTTIVIGEITNSQAFLSEDKVSIYSEFDVKVDEILKNESAESLEVGNKIAVSRGGGAVRMPSGRIIQHLFGGKPMPYIGKKYVFFLKYNAETEEYPLVTAYQIRDGQIFPLDGIDINWTPVYELASHQTYKGSSEAEFINQVQKAIKAKTDVFEFKK